MQTLTPPAHAHVYILEKSQHKVPEEALKVSNTSNMRLKFLSMSAASFSIHLVISVHSCYQACHLLVLITVWVLCRVMAADHVFLGLGLKSTVDCECYFLISLTFSIIVFSSICAAREVHKSVTA